MSTASTPVTISATKASELVPFATTRYEALQFEKASLIDIASG